MQTQQKDKRLASVKVHMPRGMRDEFACLTKRLGQTQSAVLRQMVESYLRNQKESDVSFDLEQQQ